MREQCEQRDERGERGEREREKKTGGEKEGSVKMM